MFTKYVLTVLMKSNEVLNLRRSAFDEATQDASLTSHKVSLPTPGRQV